jgi:iron complex transport system substrate-binding protein
MKRFCLFALAAFCMFSARAEIVTRDDAGQELHLVQPARRIVSLAPHITELLFAAGAGGSIVGTVEYSDYPAAAKAIPRVGGYSQLDLEAIVALKPDLVIGWQSGNPPAAIAELRSLGLPLFLSQPDRIEDVARTLELLGRLAGTDAIAKTAALHFRERYAQLQARYANKPPVSVFYEIWNHPLSTINGRQIISDVLRLCSARNVFADLPGLAPAVSVEAVLAANPEAIIASGMGEARPEWLDEWRRWPQLAATAHGNLFFVPPELIQRHTTRLLDGAERLCADIELARTKALVGTKRSAGGS